MTKSQSDILQAVQRRGATDYFSGQLKGRQFVAFSYQGFPVRLSAPAVDPKHRNPEQEMRRQWRVLFLWVKAQLEAIDNNMLEPYQVFMPFLQLKDGRTVAEAATQDGLHKVLAGTLGLGAPALTGPEGK